MKAKTVEDMLNDQIAACVAATEDCLAQSRLEKPDDAYGAARHHELDYFARLLKASARLTDALAHLRGESRQTIHVTREASPRKDGGRG